MSTSNEIQEIQKLVNSSKNAISSLYTHQPLHWHFIPPHTPTFWGDFRSRREVDEGATKEAHLATSTLLSGTCDYTDRSRGHT